MKKCVWFLIGVVFFSCFVLWHRPLRAQTYPSQPIQMVIPLSPGDTVDLAGRAIAAEMSKILKTTLVINNKPGGGGTIGADSVVRSKKDGYTLLFAISGIYYAHAVNPESVPYNPLTDLDPLCSAVSVPMMLPVMADSPWKNFGELMTYMKQNPGKVRGSSTGVGSVGFFNFEVIRLETGNAFNMIPFKGASPALTALLGGHVETSALTLGLISPHVKAGKLRVLLTSQKVPEFPDIPTLKQLGYQRDIMSIRFTFYLPVGVPDSVKMVLVPAIEKAVKTPEVVKAIEQIGAIEDFIPGEEFKKIMTEEYGMVRQLMKTSSGEGK
ncbi:MAG TPA: tripartite tricarboxylate transporter substrate binding protein [Thermodesulfobacteriota bacterium]|nr:tripartite tricarboxylate transporter substrate binding protein [Thermodesulfobacteriota bacterium]